MYVANLYIHMGRAWLVSLIRSVTPRGEETLLFLSLQSDTFYLFPFTKCDLNISGSNHAIERIVIIIISFAFTFIIHKI